MVEFITKTVEETQELGNFIGSMLEPGHVVLLTGDLGAGKTAFTGGVATGIGIHEPITSPTFTIVNEYDGKVPFYHFDVYRVADPDEILGIGFDDYLDGSGVVVIEWSDLIEEILPLEFLKVDIQRVYEGVSSRKVSVSFSGEKYNEILEQLEKRKKALK